MDDSRPLGNTQDVFNKRALHVKIGNSSSEAVPVSISEIGTPFFVDAPAQTTTPGTEQLLLTTTNAANETLYLKKIDVICRTEGTFKCKIDGVSLHPGEQGQQNQRLYLFGKSLDKLAHRQHLKFILPLERERLHPMLRRIYRELK